MKTKTIQQTITFKGVSPGELFNIYLDSKKHAAVIGSKVSISKKVGERFTAFNGWVKGKNLHIVPKNMIVQTWCPWKEMGFDDSILIMIFNKISGGAKIDLVHANVPSRAYDRINKGWKTYYWKPWKAYLKKRKNLRGK